MAPQKIKLVYFNGRGKAEVIRWVLALAKVEYEDKRVAFDDWKDLKPSTPTGMLPYAEIDGKKLPSSLAIMVYLAKQYGMMGADDWQAAEIEAVLDLVNDAIAARMKAYYCKDEAMQADLYKEYGEKKLAVLLKFTSDKLGGKQWMIGDKVSLADLGVAFFLDEQKAPFTEQVAECKAAADLMKRVKDLPAIKDWIAKRPESTF